METPRQRGLSITATQTTVSVTCVGEVDEPRAVSDLSGPHTDVCCLAGIQTIDSTQALFLPIGASVSLLVMFFFFDSVQVVFTICTAGERHSLTQWQVCAAGGLLLVVVNCPIKLEVSLLCFLLPLSSCNDCICIPLVANVPVPDQTLLPAEQVSAQTAPSCDVSVFTYKVTQHPLTSLFVIKTERSNTTEDKQEMAHRT